MITLEAVKNKGTIITPAPKDGYYLFPSYGSVEDAYTVTLENPSTEQIQEAVDSLTSEYKGVESLGSLVVVSRVTHSETRPTGKDIMFYSVPSNTMGWVD